MVGVSSSHRWKRPRGDYLTFKSFVSPRAEEMYKLFMRKGHRMMERNILVTDFESSGLFEQFYERGWLGLCSDHNYGLPILVAEFMANRFSVHTDMYTFSSMIMGIRVNFSAEAIRVCMDLPNVLNP